MANTKLSDSQKQSLKALKLDAKGNDVQIINLNNETTMAFKAWENTVEFALSVMSKDETKFRRKVGEYYAITRFYDGQTVKMEKTDFRIMCEMVYDAYLI